MSAKLAVCLISGGMDSCVCAALAREAGFDLAFMHLGYGQRTQKRELKAFHCMVDYFKPKKKLIIKTSHFRLIGASSLVDESIEPEQDIMYPEGVPSTYVPFRNANLLSMAVSWAEAIGAVAVYIGATSGDGPNYPDCTIEFIEAFNEAVRTGTRPDTNIQICAPLINMTKKEIMQTGIRLQAPVHQTWSCYVNTEKPCGRCQSCLLRNHAS